MYVKLHKTKMKTSISYKAIAILMALLMFSSSIGISMDIHFCGNELKSFSLFGDAEACEMMKLKQEKKSELSCCEGPKKEIKSCQNEEVSKGNCCHNESISMSNGGAFEVDDISIEQFQQALTAVIILLPNFNLFSVTTEKVNYAHYNPPPIIKDISVLLQVFRI